MKKSWVFKNRPCGGMGRFQSLFLNIVIKTGRQRPSHAPACPSRVWHGFAAQWDGLRSLYGEEKSGGCGDPSPVRVAAPHFMADCARHTIPPPYQGGRMCFPYEGRGAAPPQTPINFSPLILGTYSLHRKFGEDRLNRLEEYKIHRYISSPIVYQILVCIHVVQNLSEW